MGFTKVYWSLQDVFLQIDARLLRPVAIEHSKDVDAAVETVVTEIIPFFNERSRPSTLLTGGESVGERSRPSTPLSWGELVGKRSRPSTPVIGSEPFGESSAAFAAATSALQPVDVPCLNSMDSNENKNGCNVTAEGEEFFHDADDGHKEPIYDTYDGHHERECVAAVGDNVNKIELSVAHETNESITAGGCTENSIKESPDDIPCQTLGILQVVHVESSQNLNPLQYGDLATGLSTTVGNENEHEKLLADAGSSVVSSNSMTLDEQSMMSSESSDQFAVLNDKHGRITKELAANLLNESASQIECGSDATGTEVLI